MTAMPLLRLPPQSFELSVVSVNQCGSRLRACGELDLAAVDSLSEFLEREQSQGRRFVRLDVSGVRFVDALCLRVLVRAHHAFLSAHGLLILLGVSAHLEHLLKVSGSDQTLFFTRSPEVQTAAW